MSKAKLATLADALAWATPQLQHSDSAKLDAEVLLLHLLDKPRSYLFTWPEAALDETQQAAYAELVERRAQGEPVAYLTGTREFWSLPLAVSPQVLIPRPDTEALVEAALGLGLADDARVVDLGTGSGAIALALAYENPNWQVSAVDASAGALEVAKANAERLGLERVQCLLGSWFEPLPQKPCFDLVVSNPPYIDGDDPHLSQGDVRFEPDSALVAKQQGYRDLFDIAEQARQYLKPGGILMMEHGFEQAPTTCNYLRELGYQDVDFGRDLAGQPRFSFGVWPGNDAGV
ncbi:peptide chain release factor N(5)-glutamine methyltransferase [Paraferrimonas sedimenticola]|uniref:Release factor glutamine methyltransferase n=1 Tax=Paraferrimonas sedimenticola TaxID=375674 RepID=A0AA37RUN4_9GAMM|nr:peptide chain release factor N(5)-glutamine methyltransferase [Paraferrimonas sedimenticola]GLP95453.1 release factor glutamine methyltransferase [Paraferrimonas sedimenticola]